MKKAELERFRKRLDALAEQLGDDVSAVSEPTRGPVAGTAAGELSNAPMHLGDTGTEEYLHALNATLLSNEEYLLSEVIAAQRRIQDGTFGKCESCGRPIHSERLDAIPYARYCIGCAEALQNSPNANLNTGRPRTPADTLAPEGEMEEGGRRRPSRQVDDYKRRQPHHSHEDSHASGTPGGGTSLGGLAGSNVGHGEPSIADLDDAMGDGTFDGTKADESIFKRMNPDEPPDDSDKM